MLITSLSLCSACGKPLAPATTFPREASYSLPSPQQTRIGESLAPQVAAHSGQSGFLLLPNGMEALLTRLMMTQAAEKTLDAQYFIWRLDDTGKVLLEAVFRAADRGVRVRLLIDDFHTTGEDLALAAADMHPNVQVRLFNPFASRTGRFSQALAEGQRLNHRMHNKSFIVDSSLAVVGGRNIADEYFQASSQYNFNDLDVLAAGPVVKELACSFDDYWNSESAYPVCLLLPRPSQQQVQAFRTDLQQHWQKMMKSEYSLAVRETDLARQLRQRVLPQLIWAQSQIVTDVPGKLGQKQIGDSGLRSARAFFEIAGRARKEIIIVSPYFVPRPRGTHFLAQLHCRGVHVRVLTNSLASTDSIPVYSGYLKYVKPLLRSGVELHELRPVADAPRSGSVGITASRYGLHAKVYVFDRRSFLIGSLNLDPRSVHLDTQTSLFISSPELATQVAEAFDRKTCTASYKLAMRRDWLGLQKIVWISQENGHVEHDDEPLTKPMQRFEVDLLRLLPIEGVL